MTLKIKCAYIDFGTSLRKGGSLKNIIAGIFAVVMLGIIFVLIIPSDPTMDRFADQDKSHTEPTPTATATRAPTATATPTPIPTPVPVTEIFLVTAYSEEELRLSCMKSESGKCLTSTGTEVRIGVIAVDFDFYRPNTRLLFHDFPGKKPDEQPREFVAEDKGGKIKGPRRADVFTGRGKNAQKIAREWGVREVPVTILR